MMNKFLPKFLIVACLFLVIAHSFVFAQAQCQVNQDCQPGERVDRCCPKRGLVPCGTPCCPCRLCDFFVLIDRILDFILFRIAPVVAVLMLVVGGGLFLVSTGNPQTITTARRIITSVFIGLAVIYGSYFFIGLILQSIGLAQWTQDIYHSWWEQGFFEIPCD